MDNKCGFWTNLHTLDKLLLLEILHPNRCTLTLSQPTYSVFGCCKHICRLFTKLPSEGALDVGKFCSAEKGDVWLTLDGALVHIKVALH